VSTLELAATVLGLLNVTLIVRRSVWNYPFGIVMVALYAVIFWRAKLYSDAGLQVFFFVVQFYGWWAWTRAREVDGEIIVETMGPKERASWAATGIICVALWGGVMHRLTDASYPWWDGSVAILSIAAQILMTRRKIENWWLWIVVDLISVGLYAAKGLWPTMLLYNVFLLLAVWGLIGWRRAAREAGPVPA
jgi:nicotinamide mononucleotide transporter